MNSNARAQNLSILAELSEAAPELRFGQLVVNLAYPARDWTDSAIWDVEDDEFLGAAREHLAARRDRLGSNDSAWIGMPSSSISEIEPSVPSTA